MHIEVQWDAAKADANLRKHGISFEEAATSLLDPMALTQEDDAAAGEARWRLIGMSTDVRLLTIIYTMRDADRVRLISARKATHNEALSYA
jgi:uncharacterized protein